MLAEILKPTAPQPLDGVVVEAVSSLPTDPVPEWEGDDSIHEPGADGLIALTDPRQVSPKQAGPRVVPLVRVVRPRMAGQDVIAMQRALSAAGFRPHRATGWHGPISVKNLKTFQHSRKLAVSGIYDRPTHRALLRFYDSYGAWLMMRAYRTSVEHRMRAAVVATALYGVSVRDSIIYSQGTHRLDAVAGHWKPPRRPGETDCSGFATWCYQVAGAPDPCGLAYNVSRPHYTGTMATAGKRVATPTFGDLVLYGQGMPFKHVTVYIGNDRVVSHGSNPGPMILPVRYRSDLAMFRSYI